MNTTHAKSILGRTSSPNLLIVIPRLGSPGIVCLHLQGTPSEVSSVSGSEVSSIESAVGVERLQKLMARMKEYQAQIPLLEEQLQQQADEWQRHCEELQGQHTQELHAAEAGHEAALMRLRAELHGGRESPRAVCNVAACLCRAMCTVFCAAAAAFCLLLVGVA